MLFRRLDDQMRAAFHYVASTFTYPPPRPSRPSSSDIDRQRRRKITSFLSRGSVRLQRGHYTVQDNVSYISQYVMVPASRYVIARQPDWINLLAA